ncbi:MAG: hypothetical protein WD425_01500 [Nitrospirales bacterium]
MSGLPANGSDITEVDQHWWSRIRLIRIVHDLEECMIAVDGDGNPYLMTGDVLQNVESMVPGKLYTKDEVLTSSAEAIASFNSLAATEQVAIAAAEDAQEYLEFFLSVHIRHSGAYLSGKQIAYLVDATRFYSGESERLRAGLRQIEKPVVQVLEATDRGFVGTSYDWHWWCGLIKRYDLTVSRTGQVTFAGGTHAEQEP